MKAYKIVKRNYENKLISCVANERVDSCVEYKVGEYVSPNERLKHSYLFVFDTLLNAESFALNQLSRNGGFEIYECEVKQISKYAGRTYLSDLSLFWNTIVSIKSKKKKFNLDILKDKRVHTLPTPNGTIFAKKVKLTKLIKKHQPSWI